MIGARISANLSGIDSLVKRFPEVSREVRESKISEALLLLEGRVKEKTPQGAGPIHLRDTIFPKVQVTGDQVTGILGTPQEHGAPVEYGTKPHFPPTEPIRYWVRKVLGLQGKEARTAAFLIARAISRRGTKGAAMFEKGFEENEGQVMRLLEDIASEIVRRVS